MPSSGDAQVDILVGGEPCVEYPHDDGKTYVEMDLQHATSYDDEYEDDTPHGVEKTTWPVTPFQVRCRNSSSHVNYWAELHLDGEYVDQQLLGPQKTFVFRGFQNQGKLSEFLMALPRNQRVTDGDEIAGTSRLSKIGSLTVEFKAAEYTRSEDQYVPGKSSDFRQANKIEANKVAKQRMAEGSRDNMTGTARQGRTIGVSDDAMATAGHKRVAIWSKAPAATVALTVHWRQRHVLINLGAIREKEAEASEVAFNGLLVKTKEALGRDWLAHAAEIVAAAAAYQLYQLPQPAACRRPTGTTGASILKFSLGDTPPLATGTGAHARRAEQQQLEARLRGEELWPVVVEGVNSVFSAAALALYGTEDLWFLLRIVAKHDAASYPERYSDGLAHTLGELSAAVSADEALLALANATGVHFLLHGASDGGLQHVFRPADFAGKSKDQPAYVLARLPSSSHGAAGAGSSSSDAGEPTHAAVLDRPAAEALRRARADQDGHVVLRHPGTRPRDRKRAREQAIDVTVD